MCSRIINYLLSFFFFLKEETYFSRHFICRVRAFSLSFSLSLFVLVYFLGIYYDRFCDISRFFFKKNTYRHLIWRKISVGNSVGRTRTFDCSHGHIHQDCEMSTVSKISLGEADFEESVIRTISWYLVLKRFNSSFAGINKIENWQFIEKNSFYIKQNFLV